MMMQIKRVFRKLLRSSPQRESYQETSIARALRWLKDRELPSGGIQVHTGHTKAYPEVTGYIVPTLLEYGERELAARLVRWLIKIQAQDGSFSDPDYGRPHVFDTGQVLRGLLAGIDLVPETEEHADRAAKYLVGQMREGGREGFGNRYNGMIPETIHLYVLEPLMKAGEIFGKSEYLKSARQCLNYYCEHEDFVNPKNLTHFLAYELEALINLGRGELAKPILDKLRTKQSLTGSVAGRAGSWWVCVPGLAQLAICWYKTGCWEPADRAMGWLERHQGADGGFRGGLGFGAKYFPKVNLSWAAKYFLDAHQWRVKSYMNREASQFVSEISRADERVQAILGAVRPGTRVAEIGCGKGRFLKVVREAYPEVHCTGVDISRVMLDQLPAEVEKIEGGMEHIPCGDNQYDTVFSVEALEHSVNLRAALSEMIRIAKPGGWVVVIDKQDSHWGRLRCNSWERWLNGEAITGFLAEGCEAITGNPVGYDGKRADGMMMVWRGKKKWR